MARQDIVAIIENDWRDLLREVLHGRLSQLQEDVQVLDIYHQRSDLRALLRLVQPSSRLDGDHTPALMPEHDPSPASASPSVSHDSRPPATAAESSGEDSASGVSLAVRVLRERAGQVFDVPQIHALLEEAGWSTDSADARNAVGTLMSKVRRRHGDEVQRAGWGRYVWRPSTSTDPEDSAGVSAESSVPAAATLDGGDTGQGQSEDHHPTQGGWNDDHHDHGASMSLSA